MLSTTRYVKLTAPGSILDSTTTRAAQSVNVVAVDITLIAGTQGTGSVGVAENFLETDLLDEVDGSPVAGILSATGPTGAYLQEVAGDLRLGQVLVTIGNLTPLVPGEPALKWPSDAALFAEGGSILNWTAGTAPNVKANRIDLVASGPSARSPRRCSSTPATRTRSPAASSRFRRATWR